MGKVVVLTSDRLGRGNKELATILMRNFIYALARAESRPEAVYMLNNGVRLACEGSESLDDLRLLAEDGVGVYACGTCLDYLELRDSLKVGAVGAMPDVVSALMTSADVVTFG